jgi:hypothetical protein
LISSTSRARVSRDQGHRPIAFRLFSSTATMVMGAVIDVVSVLTTRSIDFNSRIVRNSHPKIYSAHIRIIGRNRTRVFGMRIIGDNRE